MYWIIITSRDFTSKNLAISCRYVNENIHLDSIKGLFNYCQKKYGRCTGNLYLSRYHRKNLIKIGWVFTKKNIRQMEYTIEVYSSKILHKDSENLEKNYPFKQEEELLDFKYKKIGE